MDPMPSAFNTSTQHLSLSSTASLPSATDPSKPRAITKHEAKDAGRMPLVLAAMLPGMPQSKNALEPLSKKLWRLLARWLKS